MRYRLSSGSDSVETTAPGSIPEARPHIGRVKHSGGGTMFVRRFFALVLAAGSVASVCAQNMDTNSQSQLTVQITYENDRKAPANLRVELLSSQGSLVESQTTDGFRPIVFLYLK